jgi:hypothetical protein
VSSPRRERQGDDEGVVQSQNGVATSSSHVSGTSSVGPEEAGAIQAADKHTQMGQRPVRAFRSRSRLGSAICIGPWSTGRTQTCIEDAAIVAESLSRRPKAVSKPVVVDIDLPDWKEVLLYSSNATY